MNDRPRRRTRRKNAIGQRSSKDAAVAVKPPASTSKEPPSTARPASAPANRKGAPPRDDRRKTASSAKSGRNKAPQAARRFGRTLPFSIVFQDRDFIVVDKPAGLLTVPFSGGHSRNLLELLQKHFERERIRPQVVHRIDRYTSGLVLFAKNVRARDRLVLQFRSHTPERFYLAVIHGSISPAAGKLAHSLKRNTANYKQHTTTKADKAGTPARLAYNTLEQWREGSLIQVQLDTGLKNQIRVQLAAVGHPIIGDQQYGIATPLDARIGRQSLHAASLSFQHPTGGAVQKFESPLPPDIQSLLRFLARSSK